MPKQSQTSVHPLDLLIASVPFQAEDIIVAWLVGHGCVRWVPVRQCAKCKNRVGRATLSRRIPLYCTDPGLRTKYAFVGKFELPKFENVRVRTGACVHPQQLGRSLSIPHPRRLDCCRLTWAGRPHPRI